MYIATLILCEPFFAGVADKNDERWFIATIHQLIKGGLTLTSIVLTHMLVSAKRNHVHRHEMYTEGHGVNDRPLTIFFISDIHRRKISRRLLKKINKSIDLVIIGGDLAEKNVPLSRISTNLRMLQKVGPLFFVWGNNDREVGETEIRNLISRYHGVILDNKNEAVPGHPTWGICGTDDPSSENVMIEAAFHNSEQYEKLIFVSHQPCVWHEVETCYEPTLMLAGHTHGGQIRIGKYGIAQKGFFNYANGKAKLLSNGYGTTKLPFRLGAPPACHIITVY